MRKRKGADTIKRKKQKKKKAPHECKKTGVVKIKGWKPKKISKKYYPEGGDFLLIFLPFRVCIFTTPVFALPLC